MSLSNVTRGCTNFLPTSFHTSVITTYRHSVNTILTSGTIILTSSVIRGILRPLLAPIVALILFFLFCTLLHLLIDVLIAILNLIGGLPIVNAMGHNLN